MDIRRKSPRDSSSHPNPACLRIPATSLRPISSTSRPMSGLAELYRKRAHLFLKQSFKFTTTVVHPHPVRRIDYPHHGIGRLEIIAPIRSQSGLSTNIPYSMSTGTVFKADPAHTDVKSIPESSRSASPELLREAYPSRISDLILNPKVGLIPVISSPLSFFKIVVFPALSSPLIRV